MTSDNLPEFNLAEPLKEYDFDIVLKKYDYYRISATKPFVSSIPVLKINNISISTEGNITVLSGDSKSGKSALCNVIIAGAICPIGQNYDSFNNIVVEPNFQNKAVLHFDTEQSKQQHYKSMSKAILKRVDIDTEPAFYYSYNIRELDLLKYMTFCKDIFEATFMKHGGIHLAVIDGAADFIKSVNDEEDSNNIVKFFEQLAINYKTSIILIIHFNPKSEKQRGHLGSQLQRKAESVLAIKKLNGISFIEPQLLRNGSNADIPNIQFSFDESKGYHTNCGIFKQISKEDEEKNSLITIAKSIFSDSPIRNNLAVENLATNLKIAKRTAELRLKRMVDLNIVSKSKDKFYTIINN
jgi:hypothetical protein